MVWVIMLCLVLPFGFVLLYGAPYLPTRKRPANTALDMLQLKKGDVFVYPGCGDGAVIIEAAKRGYICYGYELNPFVWLIAKWRTRKYKNSVHIYCRNFWNVTLPKNTQGVFVFLLDKYMVRFDEKMIAELPKGAKLVSYTFEIPDKPKKEDKQALYLYTY